MGNTKPPPCSKKGGSGAAFEKKEQRAESATTLTLVRCANGRQSHYPAGHDAALRTLAPSNKTAKPRPGSSRQMASSSNWPAARVSRQERITTDRFAFTSCGSTPDRVLDIRLKYGVSGSGSGEVYRETLKIGERAVGEGAFVCGP